MIQYNGVTLSFDDSRAVNKLSLSKDVEEFSGFNMCKSYYLHLCRSAVLNSYPLSSLHCFSMIFLFIDSGCQCQNFDNFRIKSSFY